MASQYNYQTPPPPYSSTPSNGPNPISFSSGPPPRPRGLSKPRAVSVPHTVHRPPATNQSIPRRPSGQESDISLCFILSILLVLLLTVLLIFNFDPLKGVINIESLERQASAENATLAIEKEKNIHEREVMEHERKLWEKAKDARIARGAFWDVVRPAGDCRAYGKREYWAALRNIPEGWDAMDACMTIPVEIKGVRIRRPDRCARVFVFPEVQVQGYWTVDWDQPDCKPWFRNFEQKGCTGFWSPKRVIQAEIVGINNKGRQDWRLLCRTMPLVWDMKTYKNPTKCEEWFWGKKVAVWEIPDGTC